MLSLFNNLHSREKGIVAFPEWHYVRDGLMMNLDSTIQYYRSGAFAVKSDHELIKMLFGLYANTDMDLEPYYRMVDNKALTVAQQLGYTTSISKGKIFNNIFFTGSSKEVIIINNEPFDAEEVTANWKNVRPIRILRHGFDYIDCFPLTGKVESRGISVFSINLAMLGVQYRAYRQWQKTYADETTGRNSIYHFCYAYPINNMIYDAMDHSILNRMIRLSQGMPTSDNTFRHPFHVTNYTVRCDRLLEKVLESLQGQKADIASITRTIPMVKVHDMFELMKLPDLLETRQVNWAIYLARIDMLLFLLGFDDSFSKKNQTELNQIKYHLKLYLSDGTIQSAIPKELFAKQKLVIGRIINTLD